MSPHATHTIWNWIGYGMLLSPCLVLFSWSVMGLIKEEPTLAWALLGILLWILLAIGLILA